MLSIFKRIIYSKALFYVNCFFAFRFFVFKIYEGDEPDYDKIKVLSTIHLIIGSVQLLLFIYNFVSKRVRNNKGD